MQTVPPEVRAVFEAWPEPPRNRLFQLRALIFAAAKAAGTGPLKECLKWGQPAYRPRTERIGTTVRLGWTAKRPGVCSIFVPCGTDLVDRFRSRFPEAFTYCGAREVLVPRAGPFDDAALQQMTAMALTYHRDKRDNGL